ncbi:DUF5694 domain-containing protein [Luteimonas terrae]|uniref:Haem-binding uptake Tiki superfamily ChaN domain-containing protein n=1 Tax=Luteimonas terrae TaxID=1530191 RepID=A0A4R5UCN8_9GAMM|nr:DUF5694 domain-containing protein [Luteimonas terrae]TDK33037.1 hypothetical protein E2F49_03020 [Luteimonas terrae]
MKSTRIASALLLLCLAAQAMAAEPAPPAQVMLLGTFHFANPGLDVVKSDVADVTTPANQAYLEGLASRLAAFAPTHVLVECTPAMQARYDGAFQAWRAGRAPLDVNETQQIGFRVAKAAGLSQVTCFDEGEVQWNSEPMFAYLGTHAPERKRALDATFAGLTTRENREQATLSLGELLQLTNDPSRDRENRDLYLVTNDLDAGGSFAGADAAASWWHRNFRMYANVQRVATPGKRVLVLAGQGHTAILKELLATDRQRQAQDVGPYLMP